MKPTPGRKGYLRVALYRDGRPRYLPVHRLVLMGFVGPCPDGMEGAHLNGINTDNRLANLAWVTRSENALHRTLHGTAGGERHGPHRLTAAEVLELRRRVRAGEMHTTLALEFRVSRSTVGLAVSGKTWPKLPGAVADYRRPYTKAAIAACRAAKEGK